MAERRRTSDLLHSTKCRACHAKATGDKGTPGRTSDPLQEHQVPRLPRKSHWQRGVHPTPCTALSAAPATQKPPETKGRQGVDPTPCRAPSAAPATQKPPAEQRRTRDARAYTRPLAEHQVPRLPRKSHRQAAETKGRQGVHPTPCRAPSAAPATQKPAAERRTPGRTSDPLQSTNCRACHAKATGRAAETKGRQGVHPTPCRAPSAAPATQKPPAEQRRPRDARAYIRPLAEHQVPRLPRKSHRRPRDARVYIGPLAEHQVPRLPRNSHRQSGGDQGTPGRTSDPLQSTKCRACHAKATGRAAETKGRQGVHPTPCRAPSVSIYLSISLSMYLSIYLSIKPARATAKLKLNGVSQVSQTCQADVNMQPAGQKCQLKKGRAANGVSHVYQTCQADVKTCHLRAKNAHLKKHTRETSAIYHVCQTCQGDGKAETEWIETSLSNLPGRREHAACRPKMPGKTWQGDEWRKPCLSNMPGRRLSIYLSSYLSI